MTIIGQNELTEIDLVALPRVSIEKTKRSELNHLRKKTKKGFQLFVTRGCDGKIAKIDQVTKMENVSEPLDHVFRIEGRGEIQSDDMWKELRFDLFEKTFEILSISMIESNFHRQMRNERSEPAVQTVERMKHVRNG